MDYNHTFQFLHYGLPDDIRRKKECGDKKGAIALIDRRLATKECSAPMQSSLTAQREIIERLSDDYPFTKEQAIAAAQALVPDFSVAEFETLEQDGHINWIYVDGTPRYFGRYFNSLIKTDAEYARRAGVPFGGDQIECETRAKAVAQMIETGRAANRICIRASVRIKDDFFHPDEFVRVHLPIPCACPEQSQIKILSLDPPTGVAAAEDAAQRTVCWEEIMTENHSFTVEYSYVYTAKYHDITKIQPDNTQPSFDTHEQPPHIVFTPYIRELTQMLTAGLKTPLEKARAIYDFISLHVKYTFMPSYFCLERIAESCAQNQKGDCGVMALLFITLCRCAGIPARWQSGLNVRPGFCGAHDWTMFYIAPYGWLFADPSFGTGAVRRGDEAMRRFYFGNLDPFRMAANNEFQADFTPAKQWWRADPYDNQLGEIETTHRGLRYFEYERTKELISFTPVEP